MDHGEADEIELEIETDDTTEEVPVAGVANDPAAEAFARLEGELALMRRAVQHLAAERADIVIPDYSATLAEMTKRLGAVSGGIAAIAGHPAMQLTPDSLGRRIEVVAEAARRTDHNRINQAQSDLRQATQEMRAVTAHSRTATEQRRRVLQAAGAGVLAGILLWSFLPGTITRAVPGSWQWPERMARHVLGDRTITDAGIRLIRSQNPKAWEEIAEAASLVDVNRAAIRRCRESARRSKGQVQCKLQVRN
jgi:hypothetical protein